MTSTAVSSATLPATADFNLTLPERLDRASASILASAGERIARAEVQRLSFARTRRLDPSGLEALRLFCQRAYAQGSPVRLELLSAEVYSVLSLCGFSAICELLLAPEDSGGVFL